jgi:hypothetical protein
MLDLLLASKTFGSGGLAIPTGVRALIAGALAFMLLWWTVERILGDSDDPSISFGGDWILLRASGLPLIALVAGGIGLLLLPELSAGPGGMVVTVGLLGIVMLWWGYKSEERE